MSNQIASHLLSKITVQNFKSIQKETFELSAFTPLVGYNNAGKSNILEAIKWLLKSGTLAETAFYDRYIAVEMEGHITGISAYVLNGLATNYKTAVQTYLSNDCLQIKRTQNQPNLVAKDISLQVKDPQTSNWKKAPPGLIQALDALFPEPIHIGAMENAEEDISKSKNTSTIGKILAEIMSPIQTGSEKQITSALQQIKVLLDADSSNRPSELSTFDTEINSKVNSFFPGVEIKVHFPIPEIKDLLSKGTIKVYEKTQLLGRDVATLGHGAQRSIQMALIHHLADLKIKKQQGHSSSKTLLLIDEPELYLHPQAVEVLRNALKILSQNGYQVIFSTHSPFMITSKDVGNVLLIRKDDVKGTFMRKRLSNTIANVVTNATSQLELLFSLSHSSHILFAERVLLAEGKTEDRLLPGIIQKVTSKSIGYHKVALVSMGGAKNTKKAMEVLNAMDLPTKAIVDLDYALKEGENQGFLSKNDPDIDFIKKHLANIANNLGITLDAQGWPIKNSKLAAVDAFRLLAKENAIKDKLKNVKAKMRQSNIYVWIQGTIEDHLGGISKNETGWASFNEKLENADISTILPNTHQEITDLINWAIS